MPSLVFHLAISIFFLIAILNKERLKYVPVMMLFGIISDLDVLFGIHRATMHNVWVLSAPLLIWLISVVLTRINASRNNAFTQAMEKKQIYFLLAFLLLFFHIALDTFGGGVFLLYPASNDNVQLDYSLQLIQKQALKVEEPKNISQDLQNLSEPTNIQNNGSVPANVSPVPSPSPSPSPTSTPTPNQTPGLTPIGPAPSAVPGQNISQISPVPKTETVYDLETKFGYSKPGNTSEMTYITKLSPEFAKAPIIENGIELIFLLAAIIAGVIKFFYKPVP